MEWLFTTKNGKVTLVVFCIALPILILSFFRDFFSLIIVAVGLTLLMVPLVDHFEGKGLKRNIAVVLTFVIIVGLVGGLFAISYPIAIKELGRMTRSFGVDRPNEGDSVIVQLFNNKMFEGTLDSEDSTIVVNPYDNGKPMEWESSDAEFVIKLGDTVVVSSPTGKNVIGVLRANLSYETDGVIHKFNPPQEQILTKANKFKEKLLSFEKNVQKKISFVKESDISSFVDEFLFFILSRILKILKSIKTVVGALGIVPTVTFLFLRDYHRAKQYIISSVPNRYFEMSLNLIGELEMQIGRYIRGVCIEFLVVTALAVSCYSMVHLQYAYLLGIAVGLANVIPLIGPFMGVLPAMIASVTQTGDMSFAPQIIIINFVIQLINIRYLKPRLYKDSLTVHPVILLTAVLIGGTILGLRGTILAVPIYTALAITAHETRWGLSKYQITNA